MSWGEVTGAYQDSGEAKWLWATKAGNESRGYWEPDATIANEARDLVKRKVGKYRELVQLRGQGNLLVLLHSPLTTRSTRVEAEKAIRDLLESGSSEDFNPFETVWLGYRLPWTISEEQEDPEYAFRDAPDGDRWNFLKCIWFGAGVGRN